MLSDSAARWSAANMLAGVAWMVVAAPALIDATAVLLNVLFGPRR